MYISKKNKTMQCPLLKAIHLNNIYEDPIWFVNQRKNMPDNDGFWDEVYEELIKIKQ